MVATGKYVASNTADQGKDHCSSSRGGISGIVDSAVHNFRHICYARTVIGEQTDREKKLDGISKRIVNIHTGGEA